LHRLDPERFPVARPRSFRVQLLRNRVRALAVCAHFQNPAHHTGVLHVFQKAAKRAGIGSIGTHTMRHTFRSWLDAVGTSVAVQQKAMRHSDIRTTMNTYGDVVTDELVQAGSKVSHLALNGL